MNFFTAFFTWVLRGVFPPRPTEMLVQQTDVSMLLEFIRPCVVIPEVHDAVSARLSVPPAVTALLPYREPLVQACIIEAKFHDNVKAQQLLGKILQHHLENKSCIALIPIPLGARRKKERGYNQVEEIAKFSGLPLASRLLRRTRETAPQTTLGKSARLANMQNAFATSTEPDPHITYVILDDVVTTGATLLGAREALLNAGVKQVILLALAH